MFGEVLFILGNEEFGLDVGEYLGRMFMVLCRIWVIFDKFFIKWVSSYLFCLRCRVIVRF